MQRTVRAREEAAKPLGAAPPGAGMEEDRTAFKRARGEGWVEVPHGGGEEGVAVIPLTEEEIEEATRALIESSGGAEEAAAASAVPEPAVPGVLQRGGGAAAAGVQLSGFERQAVEAAVQMMANDPEMYSVVRGLALDPNVHDAVRGNPAVKRFVERRAAQRALEGGAFAGAEGAEGAERGGGGGGGPGQFFRHFLFEKQHEGPLGWLLKHVQHFALHMAGLLDEWGHVLNHHANGISEKVTGHPLDAPENEQLRVALVLAVTVVSVALVRRPLLRPFMGAAAAI